MKDWQAKGALFLPSSSFLLFLPPTDFFPFTFAAMETPAVDRYGNQTTLLKKTLRDRKGPTGAGARECAFLCLSSSLSFRV